MSFAKQIAIVFGCTVLALATACLTGCASTGGYLIDRGRDAADIVTITAGGGVGGKARVGPFQTGLLLDMSSIGLRGGSLFLVDLDGGPWALPSNIDAQYIVCGFDYF